VASGQQCSGAYGGYGGYGPGGYYGGGYGSEQGYGVSLVLLLLLLLLALHGTRLTTLCPMHAPAAGHSALAWSRLCYVNTNRTHYPMHAPSRQSHAQPSQYGCLFATPGVATSASLLVAGGIMECEVRTH